MLRLLILALAAGSCGCTGAVSGPVPHDPRLRASQPPSPSPIAVALEAATRARLPRAAVSVDAHGRRRDCEGVALAELLRAAGAMPAGNLPGPLLSRYVLVQARDGYRVLYALAEFDPATGGRRAYLVDRCEGRPLDAREGPLWLIAPGDAGPSRWVRQVQTITVVAAP